MRRGDGRIQDLRGCRMTAPLEYLDPASWLVILVTLILFVAYKYALKLIVP